MAASASCHAATAASAVHAAFEDPTPTYRHPSREGVEALASSRFDSMEPMCSMDPTEPMWRTSGEDGMSLTSMGGLTVASCSERAFTCTAPRSSHATSQTRTSALPKTVGSCPPSGSNAPSSEPRLSSRSRPLCVTTAMVSLGWRRRKPKRPDVRFMTASLSSLSSSLKTWPSQLAASARSTSLKSTCANSPLISETFLRSSQGRPVRFSRRNSIA
mmetsp:Transcript_137579/g.383710  ORF Transcript_137579/g.383710 Transcript_137579/m.383710 type:complete len:216 (+) Transcript_137579:13-660(+)